MRTHFLLPTLIIVVLAIAASQQEQQHAFGYLFGQIFPGPSCPTGYGITNCNGSAAGSIAIPIDDRRHQLFTELSVIDSARQTLVAYTTNSASMGSSLNQSPPQAASTNAAPSISVAPSAMGGLLVSKTNMTGAAGANMTKNATSAAGANMTRSYMTTTIATQPGIKALIGSLGPLSSSAKIKVNIEDTIQALKSGDTNKALLDLDKAHNAINQQIASLTVLTSSSTLH
jgi:hypothetical protein